ncbi:uncharacterized protein LOC110449115 [Mizuhopecten yessoensis]|uniref:E3 ubiquitin/ISG15 ligase TRIM25 n=1 Tax=Mizuhopecten yessoensis TaxID=6573 RepID=A0A210QS12_MIZYE|nr:uncharacterized protein LOC110449115 [Mizuhopecten yessoensis]OWF51468.1 E3 ubiquitin/ISG15 ligase TRIM25 [Mizuhopecten yessoensis]
MDEILKCGICRSELSDPRQLQCGHVFCFECIDTDFKIRDRNNGKCPICRADFWLNPCRDTESLPKCPIPFLHILSIRKSPEQCCEYPECERRPAPFICVRCRLWLCDTCKSTTCTKNKNPLRMHEAFQQHELEPTLFDIVKRSRHNVCREHSQIDVEWYCNRCNTLACNLCKINLHEGHGSLMAMDAKVHECRAELEKTIILLKEKQNEHTKNKYTLTKLISSCCKEFVNVRHCHTALDHCNIGWEECEKLILLISKLLGYGSMKVIIETSLHLEERIKTELEKRLLLEKVREVLLTSSVKIKPEATDVKIVDDEQMQRNDDACEHDDIEPSVALCGDACESLVCTSEEGVIWLCVWCRKWLCGNCKMAPCTMGRLTDESHTAWNASDIDPALYAIVTRSRCSSCTTHPENDVESYCCECHVIACRLCCHRHEHHEVVTITTKADSYKENIEEKTKELRKKVAEYLITKCKVSKIQGGCHFKILKSKYFVSVTSECILRMNKCDNLNKTLHFLLQYASERVIVETFDKIESEIEEELQKDPSDNLSELRHVINSLSGTLSQAIGDEDTALAKTSGLQSTKQTVFE